MEFLIPEVMIVAQGEVDRFNHAVRVLFHLDSTIIKVKSLVFAIFYVTYNFV